jgi:hypothetical protein
MRVKFLYKGGLALCLFPLFPRLFLEFARDYFTTICQKFPQKFLAAIPKKFCDYQSAKSANVFLVGALLLH